MTDQRTTIELLQERARKGLIRGAPRVFHTAAKTTDRSKVQKCSACGKVLIDNTDDLQVFYKEGQLVQITPSGGRFVPDEIFLSSDALKASWRLCQ